MQRARYVLFILALALAGAFAPAQEEEEASGWAALSARERAEVEAHASRYKAFMRVAKTELSFVREAASLVESPMPPAPMEASTS